MRRTRFKRRVEIPVTPLIDIVFLLLIYFLLTSHFVKQQTLKVDLPETSSRGEILEEVLTITITREGKFFVNRKEVALSSLEEELRKLVREKGPMRVHLEADRAAKVQWLLRAMEAAKEAGFKNIQLKTVRVSR